MKLERLTRGSDLSAATSLLRRFFAEEGFGTPPDVIAANVARMAELDICAIIVAHAEAGAVGVATVSMEFGIEYGWSAELGDLYVRPEWRRQGVAARLIAAVEDVLRERGAAGYQVTVTRAAAARHGLAAFYQRLGFANEGRAILYRRF